MLAYQHNEILRTATLRRWVNAVCDSGVMTKEDFANAAIRIWLDLVPAELRDLDFRDPSESKQARNNNAIKFWRFFDGVRLPANFEEAIVFAMPEPFKAKCLRDLAARYGLLPVAIPAGTPGEQFRGVACVMKETAELIQAASADDECDLAELEREANDAIAAILGLIERAKAKRPALRVVAE